MQSKEVGRDVQKQWCVVSENSGRDPRILACRAGSGFRTTKQQSSYLHQHTMYIDNPDSRDAPNFVRTSTLNVAPEGGLTPHDQN